MRQTVNNAFNRWPGVLQALGVDPKFLRNIHGPCPTCGGTKPFRFDDKGIGSWICTHCGAGDGFQLLQKIFGWDFKKAADEVDRVLGTDIPETQQKQERSDDEKKAAIKKAWKSAGLVEPGCAAWNYLRNRCGDPGAILEDLRNHPALLHSREGGTHPAMLAMMRYPDGRCSSVHRTFITPDGRKANVDPVRKIMTGFPLAGSCVRLGPVQEHIGVAEGIETAVCAGKRFGLPVWAAISANGMACWEPPEGVRSVVICADNDESFTGQQAAYTLAKKLRIQLAMDVEIRIPPIPGTDWADKFTEEWMEG
jgi:putative DNA primase/helicase